MRRVSEGLLLGESHLHQALTDLLNGLGAVDCKTRHPRLSKAPLRVALKITHLRRSRKPTAGSRPGKQGQPCRRVRISSLRVLRKADWAFTRMAQRAARVDHSLLLQAGNSHIRQARSFIFVRSLVEGERR